MVMVCAPVPKKKKEPPKTKKSWFLFTGISGTRKNRKKKKKSKQDTDCDWFEQRKDNRV